MNYYQTLGIKENANPIEIISAYKALEEAHKNTDDIEIQLEISVAYQTLIHPGHRKEYDLYLENIPQIQNLHIIQEVKNTHKYQSNSDVFANTIIWFVGAWLLGMTMLVILLII